MSGDVYSSSTSSSSSSSGGGCGCISLIITILVVWALLFGVTYKGKSYGLSCSCDKGVEVR